MADVMRSSTSDASPAAPRGKLGSITHKLKNSLRKLNNKPSALRTSDRRTASPACIVGKGLSDDLATFLVLADDSCESDDSAIFLSPSSSTLSDTHQQQQQQPQATRTATSATIATKKLQPTPFTMRDFTHIQFIGSGSYGSVSLCMHKATRTPCVIKTVSKSQTFVRKEQQHAYNERDALATLTHTGCPYALRAYGVFQDETHLHYVIEYVPGGELFTYMVDYDTFDDAGARFLVAQLAMAVEHMHAQDIAFRDVKPENMLVDQAGYLKVCDFGFAKRIARGERSYTMCGTPEYLAPEMLRAKGHTKDVDVWAIGIFAYELLCGHTPFEGGDSRATHMRILDGEAVRFPSHLSNESVDFIRSLLMDDSMDRLGCGPAGFAELYAHPWFSGFDWDALRERRLVSPIKVHVHHPFDTSNFRENARLRPVEPELPPVTPAMDEFFAGFDAVLRPF